MGPDTGGRKGFVPISLRRRDGKKTRAVPIGLWWILHLALISEKCVRQPEHQVKITAPAAENAVVLIQSGQDYRAGM